MPFVNKNILNISSETCNAIKNADEINERYEMAFMGYDVLNKEQINRQYAYENRYEDKNKFESFFSAYEYIDDFKIAADYGIRLWDSLYSDMDQKIFINDVSNWLPLFQYQGDYIIVDLSGINSGALINVVGGYIATHLAPSVMEHLDDLIDGIDEDIYKIDEDGIIAYPSIWYLRKKMRAGELMDPRFLR